jgi:DNA-binding transcriptional LysR family regulator
MRDSCHGLVIDPDFPGLVCGEAVRDRVPAEMIAVRVMRAMEAAIVASPGYLAKHTAPRTPDDLSSHQCVQYRIAQDGEIYRWRLAERQQEGCFRPRKHHRQLTRNRAPLDGLGLAYTADALAEPFLRSGQLVRVLANWSPSIEGVYLYYQGRRQPPAALRAFIDMVRAPKGTSGRRSLKNPF